MLITLLVTLTAFEIKAQKDQLKSDKIENFHSKVLNEKRKVLIHLPRSYDPNKKKYPVLYALDATSHDQLVLNAAEVLGIAKLLPEMIIVGIVNEDRNANLTPHYLMKDEDPTELGEGNKFLEFIEKEVIPLIERNYRTSHYRMISGHSRAGLFSFYTLLEKPNLFDAYFCYSPAFWKNENMIIKKAATDIKKTELNKFLYLSLGINENDKMTNAFDAMIEVLNKKKIENIKVEYNYTKNADHSSNAYYSIPLALKIWHHNQTTQLIDSKK